MVQLLMSCTFSFLWLKFLWFIAQSWNELLVCFCLDSAGNKYIRLIHFSLVKGKTTKETLASTNSHYQVHNKKLTALTLHLLRLWANGQLLLYFMYADHSLML